MGSRSSVAPSAEEVREDLKLCAKAVDGAVHASRDIRPFTRVAVCAGRVYSDKDHVRLFGDTDAWGQWTVVKQRDKQQPIKKGFIVSPGLPGGALDPLYDNPKVYGLASFFADTQPGVEPACIYVINARKGRMEYWTGRNGALKNEKLTLCYDEEARCPKFPTVYVLYGQSSRPTSVFELAHDRTGLDPYSILRRYADYDVARPKDAASIKRWAKAYSPRLPTKLPVLPPDHVVSAKNQLVSIVDNNNSLVNGNNNYGRERFHQYRSDLHNANARMGNNKVMPVSRKAWRAYDFIATKYLGKLIRRGCVRHSELSDAAVLKLADQFARMYDATHRRASVNYEYDPDERLLTFAYHLRHNTGEAMEEDYVDILKPHQTGLLKYLLPRVGVQNVPLAFRETYSEFSGWWDVVLARYTVAIMCKRIRAAKRLW